MCKVLLFVDMEFPRGRGDQMEKSWKFQGVGRSTMKPLGKENPGGWGGQTWKNPPWGGMDIFWNHTINVTRLACVQVWCRNPIQVHV